MQISRVQYHARSSSSSAIKTSYLLDIYLAKVVGRALCDRDAGECMFLHYLLGANCILKLGNTWLGVHFGSFVQMQIFHMGVS